MSSILLARTHIEPTLDEDRRPVIRAMREGFSISNVEYGQWGVPGEFYKIDQVNVFTTTLETFSWDGSVFYLSEEQIVRLPYKISPHPILSSTNLKGTNATLTIRPYQGHQEGTSDCSLYVNGMSLGKQFSCIPEFTQVSWKDITGDNQLDVIVTALSGSNWDPPYQHIECFHQHLLAFTWDGTQANEIANVAGCVVRIIKDQFFGVLLEDIDGDGLLEIRAAEGDFPEYDTDQIYKWNGQNFMPLPLSSSQ